MKYAVVEIAGLQYRVQEGDRIAVNAHVGEPGGELEVERVLAVRTDEGLKLGTPYVQGAKVRFKVLEHKKGPKVIIFKYRRRHRSTRRKKGHRQPVSVLEVAQIAA